MVNMNAADDKENATNPDRLKGAKGDTAPCSSNTHGEKNKDSIPVPMKLNGSTPQNKDCNKCPVTNGAYAKVKSTSCSVPSVYENGGPSMSRRYDTTQVSCNKSENVQNDVNRGESEKGLSLRNSGNVRSENENHQLNKQKQSKPKEGVPCDYSSSEDEECCCIYTYKGDSNQMADLPSSFFRTDLMPPRANGTSRNSSPDMDYLEMDFDPGPSNDRYSSEDSESDDRRGEPFTVEMPFLLKSGPENELGPEEETEPPTTPPLSPLSTPSPIDCPRPPSTPEVPGSSGTLTTWNKSIKSSPQIKPADPDADSDFPQPSSCYCIANKLSSVSIDENFNEGDTMTMIWKEQEGKDKQVTQIGVSACGSTAVINTLLALNVEFSVDKVKEHVATRYRTETAQLPEYLMSRCHAGATHEDMIRGLHGASHGLVYARFFHMYPQRNVFLSNWLSRWIRKGAVPIATLNLQRGVQPSPEIPDCWHHQMIHGVGARGVFLTNPLEVVSEARLWPQLASPSVLLVRRDDVLSRWTPDTSLHPLIHPSQPLWRKLNVLGQVVNVIRESTIQGASSHSTQHITIPASYSSGITLAVLRSSPAYTELRLAPELPIDPFTSV